MKWIKVLRRNHYHLYCVMLVLVGFNFAQVILVLLALAND